MGVQFYHRLDNVELKHQTAVSGQCIKLTMKILFLLVMIWESIQVTLTVSHLMENGGTLKLLVRS